MCMYNFPCAIVRVCSYFKTLNSAPLSTGGCNCITYWTISSSFKMQQASGAAVLICVRHPVKTSFYSPDKQTNHLSVVVTFADDLCLYLGRVNALHACTQLASLNHCLHRRSSKSTAFVKHTSGSKFILQFLSQQTCSDLIITCNSCDF